MIAYCRIGERSSHTWFVLKYLLGYDNVKNYDGSWTEWGNLVGAPIEKDAAARGLIILPGFFDAECDRGAERPRFFSSRDPLKVCRGDAQLSLPGGSFRKLTDRRSLASLQIVQLAPLPERPSADPQTEIG